MRDMKHCSQKLVIAALALAMLACAELSPVQPMETGGAAGKTAGSSASLSGTSWRLLRFQGGDGRTLTPADKAMYTIVFQSDGRVNVRFDCNRGSGAWSSQGPGSLQFGVLALTRAMCSEPAMHDRIVGDWMHIRSFILKNGHLYLSLVADGGIYEFEPVSL